MECKFWQNIEQQVPRSTNIVSPFETSNTCQVVERLLLNLQQRIPSEKGDIAVNFFCAAGVFRNFTGTPGILSEDTLISLVPPCKCRDITSSRPRPCPSKYFSFPPSLIINRYVIFDTFK
jgi:hypothetical protein